MELTYLVHISTTIKEYANMIGINSKLLKDIKQSGDILLNHNHVTVRHTVKRGDILTFVLPEEVSTLNVSNLPLKIVYEDDYLMVIDKQPDIVCIPVLHYTNDTIANMITKYYLDHHIASKVHLVNRLDKETKGLMIVAKHRYIHDLMSHSHIERIYRAHVCGAVKSGTIDKPILSVSHQMKRIIDDSGKESITHYKQVKDYVYFKLETGRTHQIRVHMASIHHPLTGDSLYGDGSGEFDLESIQVTFIHPITRQIISIRKKDCN